MKTLNKKHLCAASIALLGVSSPNAQSQAPIIGYWVDSSNRIVKNSWGECWRTSSWTPALAVAECDPGLVAKVAPALPPPPAPVVAPPPPTYKTVITDKPVVLEGANFETGSSRLLPGAHAKLEEVVQQSKDHPEINFEVAGYTDNVGSAQSNVRLSQARADAVKAYLVSQGVAASRINTYGFGEEKPIAGNDTAEGRAQNRRVEIRYTDKLETRVRVTP